MLRAASADRCQLAAESAQVTLLGLVAGWGRSEQLGLDVERGAAGLELGEVVLPRRAGLLHRALQARHLAGDAYPRPGCELQRRLFADVVAEAAQEVGDVRLGIGPGVGEQPPEPGGGREPTGEDVNGPAQRPGALVPGLAVDERGEVLPAQDLRRVEVAGRRHHVSGDHRQRVDQPLQLQRPGRQHGQHERVARQAARAADPL